MNNIIDMNISFKYEGNKNYALKDISLNISEGKCIVLCGNSGCGKSSLLRVINHLIPEFYEGKIKGYINIDNEDIKDKEIGKVGEKVSSVFQDPRSQFFTLNSSLEVAFGLENYGLKHDEIIKKVDEAFNKFDLNYLKGKDVFKLSSGERQLISIIGAYALDTNILVLDEPTANLDYNAINKLESILKILKGQGKTIIISEHRLYYLKDLADEYCYIENGEIKKIFQDEEMLNLNENDLDSLHLRTIDLNNLNNKENYNIKSYDKVFNISNLSFAYNKSKKVLNNIALTLNQNEVTCLIGHNGCGKTTLGKLACGLLKSKNASFIYNNKKLTHKELVNNSLFIMQEAEFQFFTNSIINELKYGRHLTKKDNEKIEYLLKKFDLWDIRNRHPFSLSGGQMQKLVLIIAYLSEKPIVFLDEPTAGLDYKSLLDVIDLINEMKKEKIVCIISHDLELISKACDRCIAIKDGKNEKEFDLSKVNIQVIKEYMNSFKVDKKIYPKIEKPRIDSRIKIIITFTCMVLGLFINLNVMTLALACLILMCLYEHKFKMALISAISYGILVLLSTYLPSTATLFMMNFFPRIILIGTSAYLTINEQDQPYTLAGLRKLHVPEKIIMVNSVIFRFFPVLNDDLKIMNQSLKTRTYNKNFKEKIKNIPGYVEIYIVPMVFRVMRIAETLSASAETRGINLKIKRNSYINIHIRLLDILILILFICLIILGLII